MSNDSLREEFEKEIEEIQQKEIFSPEYKKKKLIIWVVRTILTIVIYYFLWHYEWVRWTLILYIPLALLSLFSILGANYFMNKKIEKTRQKIEDAERAISGHDHEE